MKRLFTILERFAPEVMDLMEIRYQILRQVLHKQPVGRRQMARDLGYTERMVRGEIDILKSWGAIMVTSAGITITPYGEELLREIDDVIPFLYNTQTLAEKLKGCFNLTDVIVIPGDSFKDTLTKNDLGRVAARYLQKILLPDCTVAVTGGTTLAAMADAVRVDNEFKNVLIVPARGGLGEEMEQQAGTIAAKIARAIGGQYRLLHIPDNLEEETAEVLRKDIHIQEMVATIRQSNILIHGIGSAIEMAYRRGLTGEEIKQLEEYQAVGEALRYYFDKQGNIVYEVPGIGLVLNDLDSIDTVIAVAGGSNKAEAIKAVLSKGHQNVLITDEGAARKIIYL